MESGLGSQQRVRRGSTCGFTINPAAGARRRQLWQASVGHGASCGAGAAFGRKASLAHGQRPVIRVYVARGVVANRLAQEDHFFSLQTHHIHLQKGTPWTSNHGGWVRS